MQTNTHLPPRYLVYEVFGDAILLEQRTGAEPAQCNFNGGGQAGREHIRGELGVLSEKG